METATPATTNQTPLQDIEDLTISLVIKNFNPTILSYEFLTMTGIVPPEWELAKQPVVNPRGSQVTFKNGVDIVAQGNALNFRQPIANKDNLDQLEVGNVAQKYVEKMLNAEYQGLSISPKIIIPFPEDDGGKNFIHDTFLNEGSWRNFGNDSVQASLTLSYQLEQCRLGVNINPAKLQQPNNTSTSAVLFAGSFNYNFMNENIESKANIVIQTVGNWQKDLQVFRELVYHKFVKKAQKQQESLFE